MEGNGKWNLNENTSVFEGSDHIYPTDKRIKETNRITDFVGFRTKDECKKQECHGKVQVIQEILKI